MKLDEVKKTKYGLAYVFASAAMVLLSIVVIVVSVVKHTTWLMFVYLGLALVYAVCILVLEILKLRGKNKKEPIKKAKKEPAKKEKKPCQALEEIRKTKYGMIYVIASCAIFLLSILVIVLALVTRAFWLIFVYLGFALAYAVLILVLEILKGKAKKEEALTESVEKETAEEDEEPEEEIEEDTKREKAVYVPFTTRLRRADPFVAFAYNEIKSELLSYGLKSRLSQKGDSFRLHRKLYTKITIAGKTLKLYMALNPKDYENTTIPFKDASDVKKYEETPFVFKAKSDLSIRRAKRLIEDMASKDGLEQKEVVAHNHTKDALKRKN